MEDMEFRVFTLIVSMEDPIKKGNQNELQELFEEGWSLDFVSDKMTAKNGDQVLFMTLERSQLHESGKK